MNISSAVLEFLHAAHGLTHMTKLIRQGVDLFIADASKRK
jgi:phage tail protein X